ncbi:hypothetical protein AB0759_03190, partial [Scytonema tolypothrichoides VB-61278_2]
MNGNSEKKLFKVLTSTVGIFGASFLLSLPAFAMPNSNSRGVKVSEAPVDTLYSQSQVPEPTGGNTMERMRQGENLNNNRNTNNTNTGSQGSQNGVNSQSPVPEPTGGNTMERMRQGENLNNNRNTNNTN